ncbi:uncharacterized protein LOC135221097 [Macrobrachium nipponense]|uniref:uncharacterized protein LOC135221097 n=1 Tax=Macrobrachium nipponense TaxID=159736 RepID=UPI0030C7B0FF
MLFNSFWYLSFSSSVSHKNKIMQAEYQDLNGTRASDMSELNVMDFVETEYKSDVEDILLDKKPRRKGQRKSKLSTQYEFDNYDDGSKVSNYPRKSRKCLQRKRRRSSMKSKSVHDSVNSDNHLYPYATLMKVLCNEVGEKNVIKEPRTGKLFKQLSHANLCYPYATFLQELHEIANKGFGSISPSVENDFVDPSESEISQVMKSFRFKSSTLRLGVSSQSEDGKDDFKRTFSTLLLDLVNEHKLQDQSHKDDRTVFGVGKILKMCMFDVPGTKPAEELSFSALLQGLSLLAERENTCDSESESVSQVLEESSESSLEEEEEEWRPSFCRELDGIPDVQREHKKKSLRRKKPVSRFDPTPGKCQSSRVKSKQHMQSSSSSQSLLQLILNKGNEDTVQKVRNKKAKESLLRSEVLEKIKDKINSRKGFTDTSTDSNENIKEEFGNEESLSEGSLEEQRNFYGAIAARKRERSLLKEYLLKPTDEEMTSKSYADTIPIMSGNSFVFSKLLQNFQMGSDKHLMDSYHENLEDSFSSSILRKMLIEKGKPLPNSTSDDELHDVENVKPIEHIDLNSLQSFLCENNSEEEFPSCAMRQEFENKNDIIGEKLRERISQALEGSDSNLRNHIQKEDKSNNDIANCLDLSVLESCSSTDPTDLNPVCKIKCEVKCEEEFIDGVRECDICHIEFSSSVDYNNHEMLFHCRKEAEPQSSGPTCALPHGSDILQAGLFQEKLPA